MKRYILIILALSFITSCDCNQITEGVILDKETKRPVANVVFSKDVIADTAHNYDPWEYSDSAGHFEYRHISGGIPGCPDVHLSFIKPGYKTLKLTFSSSSLNNTVYLEKTKP